MTDFHLAYLVALVLVVGALDLLLLALLMLVVVVRLAAPLGGVAEAVLPRRASRSEADKSASEQVGTIEA